MHSDEEGQPALGFAPSAHTGCKRPSRRMSASHHCQTEEAQPDPKLATKR